MKDMNTRLSEKDVDLLRNLIGNNLVAMGYSLFGSSPAEPIGRIGFVTDKGLFYLDNDVEWREECFAAPDYLPVLYFKRANSIDEFPFFQGNRFFHQVPLKGRILDVWLVQDDLEILKSGAHFQSWASTEGIVLVTDVRQYGFYKNSTWMGEILLVYKGQDVLTKLEPLSKHWDIFGRPMDAVVRRNVVSLSKGSLRPEETARIHGAD